MAELQKRQTLIRRDRGQEKSIPSQALPPIDGRSADEAMRAAVAEVQRLVRYKFRNPALLEEALTHSSYRPDYPSYERLGVIGNAALSLAFIKHFFDTYPELGSRTLTNLRKANTSTEKLARVAVHHGLYRFFRRRNTDVLDNKVDEFSREVMKEREKDCHGFSYGGRTLKAPKVLRNIVRSIAATIYVDCNFDLQILWKVFREFLEPIITPETWKEQPVTLLYEHYQKHGLNVYFKDVKKGNVYIANALVDGKVVGVGSAEQRLIAKVNAARDALTKLPDIVQADSPDITVEEKEGSEQNLNDQPFYKRRGLCLVLCIICYLVFHALFVS